LEAGENSFEAIVVPPCRLMPEKTLLHLCQLAQAGATVIFQSTLPADVPGLGDLAERRKGFQGLIAALHFTAVPGSTRQRARLGSGQFLLGPDLDILLRAAGIHRESMVDLDLYCIRRHRSDGTDYFIVNRGAHSISRWVPLGRRAQSALLLDPQFSDRTGCAALRASAGGESEAFLQLGPGESIILRTTADRILPAPSWVYEDDAASPPQLVTGSWRVHFIDGGPVLPRDYSLPVLASWTGAPDPEARRFAGTAVYRLIFPFAPGSAADWRLDLGRVCESARVRLNGHDLGTLWCPPFSIRVGPFLRRGDNELEVEVTNLAANRIADLDRRHVPWKIFPNINVVNSRYQLFDASGLPLFDSGLLGPVRLVPQEIHVP
jgi:hypothetical protein